MTIQITYISDDYTNGDTFPVFMYNRISALHITIPQYINRPELIYLLKYRSWSRGEIEAHFYNIEYNCNRLIFLDKQGELDTNYTHEETYYYLQFLHAIADHSSHREVYSNIVGTEFGIFDWAQPTDSHGGHGIGNIGTVYREVYTWKNRPKLEGKVTRRMYQGADYVCAGRALTLGLIEQKPNKKVIWLSVEEHKLVRDYARSRRK
jgi:hypothetical protein